MEDEGFYEKDKRVFGFKYGPNYKDWQEPQNFIQLNTDINDNYDGKPNQ